MWVQCFYSANLIGFKPMYETGPQLNAGSSKKRETCLLLMSTCAHNLLRTLNTQIVTTEGELPAWCVVWEETREDYFLLRVGSQCRKSSTKWRHAVRQSLRVCVHREGWERVTWVTSAGRSTCSAARRCLACACRLCESFTAVCMNELWTLPEQIIRRLMCNTQNSCLILNLSTKDNHRFLHHKRPAGSVVKWITLFHVSLAMSWKPISSRLKTSTLRPLEPVHCPLTWSWPLWLSKVSPCQSVKAQIWISSAYLKMTFISLNLQNRRIIIC